MEQKEIEFFVEAALLAAGRPLSIDQIQDLFDGRSVPEKSNVREAIAALNESYQERGIIIDEVASGFRLQIKSGMADRLKKLWEERPPRYSRALFETLALIAYRQPITRGEIEEIRGVAVSSNIMRSLVEREWVRVVGHRDVPGRPAMFGTTKAFLDYFSLKKLDDLPELADLSDWESLRVQLDLPEVDGETANDADGASSDAVGRVIELSTAKEHAGTGSQDSDEQGGETGSDTEAQPPTDVLQEESDNEPVAESDDDLPELKVESDHVDLPELQVDDEDDADVELPELSELVSDLDEQSTDDAAKDAREEEQLVVSEWPDPAPSEGHVEFDRKPVDVSKDS